MDEDQGRASPPLPSKGSYNIDFDALDDSFNPFSSKAAIGNSPPLGRKNPPNGAESLTQSVEGGGDCPEQGNAGAPQEASETPKKKKTKSHSSKRASAVVENEGSGSVSDLSAAGDGPLDGGGGGGGAAAAADVPDKPVKVKKVKKPKSRPVSKNLEPKADGQGTPEKTPTTDESTADAASTPTENVDARAATPQDSSAQEDAPVKPQAEKTPEHNQQHEDSAALPEESSVDKNLSEKSSSQTDEATTPSATSDQPDEKSPGEQTSLTQDTLAPPDTTSPREKSPRRHKDKSPSPLVGEDGAEGSSKKEKSSGKTKKTKTKVKKSSKHSGVEGELEGADAYSEKDKDSKAASSISSHGDAPIAHDSAVDGVPVKAKHPASRVLEQQVRDDQSPPGVRNTLPNDSEDDFYDAVDSPQPPMTMEMMDPAQSYSDMNDSCTLFQSHDALAGLAWSQDESALLDEGAGEAAFAEDLTLGESDMAESHSTESVVKLVQVLKYSQSDWNKLRQELELTFQAQLLAKEKEWSAKLADRDARLATLEEGNKKLRQTNDDMRTVMGEFEKTIGQLQSEKEKTSNASQQSLQDVVKERDQALEDLQSVETAFSDLHRRYEKTKGVVDGFKQNEEVLKKCVQDLQNKLKKSEQKVQVLKEQAEEKLERATEEIEKTKKSTASDIAKLEAALRKADLQVQSMESTLEQKVKENKELAAICDELIAKVQ